MDEPRTRYLRERLRGLGPGDADEAERLLAMEALLARPATCASEAWAKHEYARTVDGARMLDELPPGWREREREAEERLLRHAWSPASADEAARARARRATAWDELRRRLTEGR